MNLAEDMFDLPLRFVTPFICSSIALETDFLNESDNSARMRDFIESESELRGRMWVKFPSEIPINV